MNRSNCKTKAKCSFSMGSWSGKNTKPQIGYEAISVILVHIRCNGDGTQLIFIKCNSSTRAILWFQNLWFLFVSNEPPFPSFRSKFARLEWFRAFIQWSNAIHSREKHISPFGDRHNRSAGYSLDFHHLHFLLLSLRAQQLSFDRITTKRHWLI